MLEAILRILALTRKELLAVLKDPRGRFSLLVPPILQCLIFGYAATYDLNDVPYAVLDQDRSAASRELLARLDGSRRVPPRGRPASEPRTSRPSSTSGTRLARDPDRPGFRATLLPGQPADVQVIADGRNSNTAGTALGYVEHDRRTFNADWRATHGQAGPPVQVDHRGWYNPNLETRWHMIPA